MFSQKHINTCVRRTIPIQKAIRNLSQLFGERYSMEKHPKVSDLWGKSECCYNMPECCFMQHEKVT